MALLRNAMLAIFDSHMPLSFASNNEDETIADTSLLNHAMSLLLHCVCVRKSDDSLVALDEYELHLHLLLHC